MRAFAAGRSIGYSTATLKNNIFLDEVMDGWMHAWRTKKAQGDVIGVRYVDDAVFGFQHESDARQFLAELREQLEANGLRLHPDKTRLIEFGRFAASNRNDRGEGKPEPFDFLGFTHTCGQTRNGKFKIRRVTIAKRMTRKLAEIKEELRKRMHDPVNKTGAWLKAVMAGATRYFGIPGNMKSLRAYYAAIGRMWRKSIRRRSQKAAQRWSWERFYRLQFRWLPRPRVCHPYPSERFDAKYPR